MPSQCTASPNDRYASPLKAPPIRHHTGGMASLTLKDIPPDLLERLRARAREQRRSLSAEALTILERHLRTDYRTPEERAETAKIWSELVESARGLPDWDVPAIYAARTPGRPVEL
jgi:plasmid stability protein